MNLIPGGMKEHRQVIDGKYRQPSARMPRRIAELGLYFADFVPLYKQCEKTLFPHAKQRLPGPAAAKRMTIDTAGGITAVIQDQFLLEAAQVALINANAAPYRIMERGMHSPVHQVTVNALTGNFVGDSVISNPAMIICSHKNIKAQLASSVIVEKFVPGTCGNQNLRRPAGNSIALPLSE